MAINFNDPRFQERMLGAAADPRRNMVGAGQQITGDFTRQQQGQLNQFRNLATQRKGFESSMKLSEGRLGLAQNRMRFQNKMFKQGLKDKRQELNRSLIFGGLTAGTSILMGRARAKTLKADRLARAEHNKTIERILRGKA